MIPSPLLWQTGLEEAVTAFRAALKEYTRERVLLQWAMTRHNLATAFQALWRRGAAGLGCDAEQHGQYALYYILNSRRNYHAGH